MVTRPSLTIAQAIEQFNLSRTTVRRSIENGKFPHATKDEQGRWKIPVDDLVAAGVMPRKTWLNERAHEGGRPAHNEQAHDVLTPAHSLQSLVATELAHPHNEHAHELAHRDTRIAQLEAELNAEKRLREAAETNANDLRTALRMIEATPNTPPHSAPTHRRRWWQR